MEGNLKEFIKMEKKTVKESICGRMGENILAFGKIISKKHDVIY